MLLSDLRNWALVEPAHFPWLNDKNITALHCTKLLRPEISAATAKQQLRASAEGYPQPPIMIGCYILLRRKSFLREGI
jgi:hypothetical protein